MKKLLLINIMLCNCLTVFGQGYTLNLQKYWWYRYRLVNDFMKVGPNFGESIPCEQRIDQYDGNGKIGTEMHWGDAMQKQGNYLIVLATENKLLKLANLSTGRTNLEIYYALNAIDRIDNFTEEYYRNWNNGNPNNTINTPIQNNQGMNPHNYGTGDVWKDDRNGFMTRDDVPWNFAQVNSTHFNRSQLCTDFRNSGDMKSDYFGRSNQATQDVPPHAHITANWWSANNTNHYRIPCEISLDQVVELTKGLAMVIYLVPPSETVTVNGTTVGLKDMAKDLLLRIVNYCSNPHTATFGSYFGWRNWQIVNPITVDCVYGVNGNEAHPCQIGAGSGANMSLVAQGFKDMLGQINAGWNSTQNAMINNLTVAPAHAAAYQVSKGLINPQPWTYPLKFDCTSDGNIFATSIAALANDWRLLGTFNVSQYYVQGMSFPCQIRYPQLPLMYRILHGGSMPHPENPFLFQYSIMPALPLPILHLVPLNPIQVGFQNSYISDLDEAPLCGPYCLSGDNRYSPAYKSWIWSSYDWATEAKKRGGGENGIFPGIDYMSIFNLYCMNDPSYANPKFYSNPYYRENLSQVYPYVSAGVTYGDAARPTYLKYLEYLSTTSHVTPAGRVTYRCGQQIELLPGFQADNGSNFLAYIKDYGCGDCGGDAFSPNVSTTSSAMGEESGDGPLDVGNSDDDGPFTIDSVEDIVPFVPYEVPIDTSIQYEPTDSLLTQDSINLYTVIMESGDSELINAVQQWVIINDPNSSGGQKIYRGNMQSFNPIGYAISPNPNNGSFTVTMAAEDTYQIVVIDIYGKTIYESRFSGSRHEVNLNAPPPGNYTVKIIGPHSSDVGKIVITR